MTLEIQNLVGLDFVWRSVLYGNITGNIIRGLKNGRSGKVDQIVTVLTCAKVEGSDFANSPSLQKMG